jgi:hypothetical protein
VKRMGKERYENAKDYAGEAADTGKDTYESGK